MNTSLQILLCVALIIMVAKLAGAVTARFGLPLVLGEQMTSGGVMSWRALAMTLTKMAVCLAALFWIGPPVTRWILKQAGRLHGHHTEVAAARGFPSQKIQPARLSRMLLLPSWKNYLLARRT